MKHRTGEVAPYRGVYLSDCRCRAEFAVRQGKKFPPCPKCTKSVTWYFHRSVLAEVLPPTPPPIPHPSPPPDSSD